MTQPLSPLSEFVRELDLPSGGHITFGDPEDLTGKTFKRIVAMLRDGASEFGQTAEAVDGIARALIVSWTLPYAPGRPKHPATDPWPLPADDPEILGELSIGDYRAVFEHVIPAVKALTPGPVTPDDAEVPGSPTAPAGG